MPKYDYNSKYRFISDGTWFDKETEGIVVDGSCIWSLDSPQESREYSFEELIKKIDRFHGLFEGLKNGSTDQELCTLDEFEIKLK